MPRAKTILQSEFPYNISARCINREWFQVPMSDVWDVFCCELLSVKQKLNLEIHSFVLMSNHFHLIASTPDANISQCMHQFMHRSSKKLTGMGNRINQTFAGRHYKTILQHPNYFLNAYKYNYRNPVAVGLADKVENYKYSTLHSLVHGSRLSFSLTEDATYQSDPIGTLEWLNTPPDPEKLESVRYGLKRQYFAFKKSRNTNAPILNGSELI